MKQVIVYINGGTEHEFRVAESAARVAGMVVYPIKGDHPRGQLAKIIEDVSDVDVFVHFSDVNEPTMRNVDAYANIILGIALGSRGLGVGKTRGALDVIVFGQGLDNIHQARVNALIMKRYTISELQSILISRWGSKKCDRCDGTGEVATPPSHDPGPCPNCDGGGRIGPGFRA